MTHISMIILVLLVAINVHADVYLHNPPGSNNRLNGNNRNRKNANRLFDSQNNERGGYNVGESGNTEGAGSLTYIGGSKISIQWTNQHECGGANTGCDLVLQYMCEDGTGTAGALRDGRSTRTISTSTRARDDTSKGRHEDQQYYSDCANRARDTNLYHADQTLRQKDARSTRQNNKGKRSGLECPEERDYYPYHAPTPWKDIAILTNNVEKCDDYKAQSQNVKGKGFCKKAKARKQPITQAACQSAEGTWSTAPSHGLPVPDCQPAPVSRDNQLGNTVSKDKIPKTLAYEWKVPNINAKACVLRMRYNISVGDYAPFGVDKSNDKTSRNGAPKLDIGSEYGLRDPTEAKRRGYEMKNNPRIKPLKDTTQLEFQLAINTAQTGRTFQDRTHKFKITRRENVPDAAGNAPIHNLNVMGKRGNIVQVYPAVEYGFEPAILKAKLNDIIHPQWTGSLRNPRNNDGEGRKGEDKSNIIAMTPIKFGSRPRQTTHPANSYPLNINTNTFLGVDKTLAKKLAFPTRANNVNLAVGTNTAGSRSAAGSSRPGGGTAAAATTAYMSSPTKSCWRSCRRRRGPCSACGAGGSCCNRSSRRCPAKMRAVVTTRYSTCVKYKAGRKDEPEPADDNVEKDEDWSFAETIKTVEDDFEQSDEQIADILDVFDEEVVMENEKRRGRDSAKLDNAPAYVNLGPVTADKAGEFNYVCTRNNNFSNRSQKGKVIVASR